MRSIGTPKVASRCCGSMIASGVPCATMRPARNQRSFSLAHDAFVRIREDIVHRRRYKDPDLDANIDTAHQQLNRIVTAKTSDVDPNVKDVEDAIVRMTAPLEALDRRLREMLPW